MRIGRGAFEVRGESECCEGCQYTLFQLALPPINCDTLGSKYHSNPDMNPPTRQKLKHNRALGREHIRILSCLLLLLLFLRKFGARVIHGPRVDDLAIAGLDDAAGRMGWWAEFVGLD